MKHKSDYLIGRRCFDFLIKKYGTVGNVLKSTPVKKSTLYQWANGDSTPSAYWLQYLAEIGANVNYLLTGKQNKGANLNV